MFNLTLPDWVNEYFKKIEYSQDLGFYFDYYNREMAQLSAGNYLKMIFFSLFKHVPKGGIVNQIRKNIKAKVQANSGQELFLFSSVLIFLSSFILKTN